MQENLIGKIFGRLTVLSIVNSLSKKHSYLNCICICGTEKKIRKDHLISGKILSCGCFMIECIKERTTIHGGSAANKRTPEYMSWRAMIQRINSKSYHARHTYKGKNISICKRWRKSFPNFLSDMGLKPTRSHTLDRFPNKNGDYKPSNCRWATIKEQQNNRTNNRHLTYKGSTKSISEWATFFDVTHSTLSRHLKSKTISDMIQYYEKKKGISYDIR